jgi:hypothetical protein
MLKNLDSGIRNEVVKFAMNRNTRQTVEDIKNHSLEFVVFQNFREFVNCEANKECTSEANNG